jgi:glycosyltransferase involved in cell wall biosynthesis
MAYNSEHMRELYRRNAAGVAERANVIAHQGIDDAVHDRAAALRGSTPKDRWTVLAVSVMAHWKGIETLVGAVAALRRRGVPAQLRLVGPWPDAAYQRVVRREISRHALDDAVAITGEVSTGRLWREYASARVFALTSRCESFGIPAIEAQAFATPVVGADACAMPDICGDGGVFGPAGDVAGTADRLERLLTDDDRWQQLSDAAARNAARYRWSVCSQPLRAMFELASRSAAA